MELQGWGLSGKRVGARLSKVWIQSLLKSGHCSECMYLKEKLESTGAGHLNPWALSLP